MSTKLHNQINQWFLSARPFN